MDHEIEYRAENNDDSLSVSDLSTSVCDKFESDKEPEFVSNPLRRSVSAGHLLQVETENGENSHINALNNLQLHSKTPAKKTRNGFSQILPSKPKIFPSTSKSTKVSNKYSMSRLPRKMNLEPTSYTINNVVPFKDSVQDYLKFRIGAEGNEQSVTDQLALLNGGVLTDIRYSWLSNGSTFEVIHTKTGSKVAAWNFGALLHDFDTIVACVTDLPSIHGKPPIVVVGLDCELTGGMICFFDINSSRVIRTIHIDDKVSSIHVVNAGNDLSLPVALRALDGVLAIGTHRGKVLLMDICRQICDEAILNTGDRVKDEINSCHLTFLSLCDLEHLEYHKECSLKNEDYICIQLNPHSTSSEHFALLDPDKEVCFHANMVDVAISALFYCPQLRVLY